MVFVEITSNYTKIIRPKSWVKTKLNEMKCRKIWVAYLKKLHMVYKKSKKSIIKPMPTHKF